MNNEGSAASGPRSFETRFKERAAKYGPLCVGIDPSVELLTKWGLTLDARGLEEFSKRVLELVEAGLSIVKPQMAFFEQFGPPGLVVLADLIKRVRLSGTLVLLDCKCSDIGTTVAAYANSYFGPTGFDVDAVTAVPYLGVEALSPLFARAHQFGGCVFVVARSSNAEGLWIQDARGYDGRTVSQFVIDDALRLSSGESGSHEGTGFVIGGTRSRSEGVELANLIGQRAMILVPGIGAQGATMRDVQAGYSKARGNVIPSASRSVLSAGPSSQGLRSAMMSLRTEAIELLGSVALPHSTKPPRQPGNATEPSSMVQAAFDCGRLD